MSVLEVIGYLSLGVLLGLLSQALEKKLAKDAWVDLTDEEMLMIYGQNHEGKKYNLGRMVQQALKEKNT